jgi:type II secretory pathway component PulF
MLLSSPRRVSLGHRKLSAWYRQLAQQLEAGLPLAEALASSRGTGMPARTLDAMAARIIAGGSVEDALRVAESSLPLSDLLALAASGEAGRMPRTLHHLSTRHAELGKAKLKVIFACIYPLGVLHLGLLLLPLMRMIDWEKGFHWSATAYRRGLALGLVPLWAVGIALVILARRGHPLLGAIAGLLPGLRGYVRSQALADFSFALANFLESGIPIGRAWASAGLTTRSKALRAAAVAMGPVIDQGAAPGPRLHTFPCFPPDFAALYRSGEQTGQLDANLHRLSTQYQDSANRSLGLATLIYPSLLFLVVAGAVVYHAVKLYSGYLNMLGKLAA